MARDRLSSPVGPDDHATGPADAPVVLVEYADYACARSARAYLVLEEVLAEVGELVCLVFRHFPLTDVRAAAGLAAEAAESAAEHGGSDAFWTMHAMLFANTDALDVDDLLGYAAAAGVDAAAVAEDLSTGAKR